jgi:transposase
MGSKTHIAVVSLGHLSTLYVTPANQQDQAQFQELAQQDAIGKPVEVDFANEGFTGEAPAQAAQAKGLQLKVVKLLQAKQGFVWLPRRWVVERSFAWAVHFRRLARDYERLSFLTFAILTLKNFVEVMARLF